MDSSKLIAHRGDNTHYPENTLLAIEEALKSGALFFECDVQMSADHSLVAFHDEDFLRMTGNDKRKIYELSDEEMNQLSVHEPDQFGKKHYPTKVTYLDELIELLKRYPKVHAFIEIKDESLSYWGVDFVMKRLIKRLENLEKQVSIISFNVDSLSYTKANSDLSIGLVFEEYSQRMKAIATELSPEYLICYHKILPEEKVWSGTWQWMVYTINEVRLAHRILERGDINFVETDDIQLMLKS